MKYHRYGHLLKALVQKGDKVKKGQLIARLGNSGTTSAHLHYDILTYKPVTWREYVIGKSKQWVKDHYADPRPIVTKTIPTQFDHLGYGWLSLANYGGKRAWHSGLDINGKGAGNADLGNPIYSVTDGVVEYAYNGSSLNHGWGRMIIIKETAPLPDKDVCKETKRAIKKYVYDYGHRINKKEDKLIAHKIKILIHAVKIQKETIDNLEDEIRDKDEIIKTKCKNISLFDFIFKRF